MKVTSAFILAVRHMCAMWGDKMSDFQSGECVLGALDSSSVEVFQPFCVQTSQKNISHLAAKRFLDIVLATLALIALAPLLLTVICLIRCESPGGALFTQTRWGMNGKKIKVYKFRSMYVDKGDPSGVAQTVVGDQRITKVGRYLRRFNVDELPQLINVIRGDMSVVGPRCHAVGMFAAGVPYETLVPEYHQRHAMRPGLTGLAQMRGLRGPTDRPSKARARINADLHYIENFSFWLDCRIIVGTIYSEMQGGNGF